ncbi:MAG: hypothetical protein LC778_10345 [Acidobacteria bacterium]|nr:hypothetical protein [Acidobacteriota bacterium]
MSNTGLSIREALEKLLEEAVQRYLKMKDTPVVSVKMSPEAYAFLEAEKLLAMQRGIVRGIARAVLIWRNMYYRDRIRVVKEIETEFVQRVKEK